MNESFDSPIVVRIAASTHQTAREQANRTRERMREQLRAGRLDDRIVEVDVQHVAMPSFESDRRDARLRGDRRQPQGHDGQHVRRTVQDAAVEAHTDALQHLIAEESSKLVDMESGCRMAVQRVEQAGIIFIHEISRRSPVATALSGGGHGGLDVSREGVQRDILPIVEGTTVNTKHGMRMAAPIPVRLRVAVFTVSKPSGPDSRAGSNVS